jgi:CO/xanthine dehydrogenase Mo-binding subunit
MAEPFYRGDAAAKVAGRAIYGVDVHAPGMLVGGVVRAALPRGRITRLDVTAAAALPGVTVLTADDLPVPAYGMVIADQPPLASSRVRFAAEPIAIVAAGDDETLQRAISAVVVEIQPEPGVFDLEEALLPDSPRVHPDLGGYPVVLPTERDGNICGRSVVSSGDVAAAFATASTVVESRYTTQRVHQGYIEPRACLAVAEADGGFHVTTSTQNPFGVRATLSKVLSVPESRIRVVAATVGGGFGGKLDVTLEHFACLLARATGRPVKMVSSRAEELAAANPRENSVVFIRSALDDSGRITGREVMCLLDAGAYAHDTPFIGAVASLQATGPYRIDNVCGTALSVYTNTQPTGAYRGPSGPQMVLAVEAHLNEIARTLGEDPVQLRRRHLFRHGDVALNGQVVESPSITECLDRALAAIGYDEPRRPGHGIGVACAWWTTTAGPAAATVRLESDGTLAIVTGATEIGSGALATGVVHLAAEALGLPPDCVRLASTGDTGVAAYDFGAQGSRTTFNVGNAVLDACASIRDQLLAEAAKLIEANPADLELTDGGVAVRGEHGNAMSLAELAQSARARSGPIHASARYVAPPTGFDPSCVGPRHFYPAFHSPSFHCHAVEVAVDGDTGRVRIVRYVAAQDVGRALVPPAIEGQIHGGVLQGIGLALYEEERLTDGVVANAGFDGYKMPTTLEAPEIECLLVESASEHGPHGAKGVGEPPIILPAAAIVNAVADATGIVVPDLPLTPERVLAHLTTHGAGSQAMIQAEHGAEHRAIWAIGQRSGR